MCVVFESEILFWSLVVGIVIVLVCFVVNLFAIRKEMRMFKELMNKCKDCDFKL